MRLILPSSDPGRDASAFTLLEVLVAMAMFAILMSVLGTVFFGAFQLQNRNERALADTHQFQQALTFFKRDLNSVMIPVGETNMAGHFLTGDGVSASDNSRLEFHAASGLTGRGEPWGDIQRVYYSLRSPQYPRADGGRDLVRGVTRNLLATMEEDYSDQTILPGVQDLRFEFWDGATWVDTWDSSTIDTTTAQPLPAAIRVSLIRVPLDEQALPRQFQMVFPVLVKALTNRTTQATTTTGGGR